VKSVTDVDFDPVFVESLRARLNKAWPMGCLVYEKFAGRVNCRSARDFEVSIEKYFHNAFSFSIGDAVAHTGFSPMAHYLRVLCTTANPR
jgi:hypothetical protein